MERKPELQVEDINAYIKNLAETGVIVLDVKEHRYIRNDDLFIPCIRWEEKGKNVFRVKSILTWDMVEDRVQRVIDNYL
jgi:hypothetical protein